MQEMSNMVDDNQKGKSSDELTPHVLERKDNDEVDDERKNGFRIIS